MMEAGAGGYIGGLWPVDDQGAAEFSRMFYAGLEVALRQGEPANIAAILAQARKLFYQNQDPTFLAYAYYGDPHFSVKSR